MWAVSSGWRDALAGDVGMEVAAAVWLGGDVTVPDLLIESGEIVSELAGGQVQTTLTATVSDPTAELYTGWAGSPIDALGHRLRLTSTAVAGAWSETVPEGVLRINTVDPDAVSPWRLYPKTGQWVRGAQTLRLSCGDLLDQVADERFMVPMSVPSISTVGGEVRRLLAGIVPVGLSVTALLMPVPASVVYDEQDRLGTVVNLLRVAGMVPAVDRAGVLQAIPATGSGAVWNVPMDALIEAVPSSSRDGLVNAYVVTSETESREPLRGDAVEYFGPLRFGGPFGRVPAYHNSPVLGSNISCARAARTMLDSETSARRRDLTVVCIADPALDVLDTARIDLPSGPVDGLVTRIARPLLSRVMTLRVSVDWEAVR